MRIGIECHNLEKEGWGTRQGVLNIIKAIHTGSFDNRGIEFYLYFNTKLPDLNLLKHPMIIPRLLKPAGRALPFWFFYHVLMPLAACIDKVDVLFLPGYMMPACYIGKSIVVLTNDLFYGVKYADKRWKFRVGYGLFGRLAAKTASRVMTYSQFAKEELARCHNVKENRIFVNRLAVDLERFNEDVSDLELPSNYILYVGQLFPRRRIEECLRAFRIVRRTFKDLSFVIVGPDKSCSTTIQCLVREINAEFESEVVLRHGYVTDAALGTMYRTAKLLLYISSSESFGLPPFEAFLLGTPSVVKRSPLASELFGKHVFHVYDETDPSEIATVILDGLRNEEKRAEIWEAGRVARDQHQMTSYLEQLIEECEQLASKR